MKSFKEFLAESVVASTVNTDMKNTIPFIHTLQVGWIGGWKGVNPAKETALMPPFSGEDTYDGFGDYDNYPTKSGEVLARIGSSMTNKSGTSNAAIIKLNLSKGTIAFLKDYDAEGSDLKWEKGIKFGFLQISKEGIKELSKR